MKEYRGYNIGDGVCEGGGIRVYKAVAQGQPLEAFSVRATSKKFGIKGLKELIDGRLDGRSINLAELDRRIGGSALTGVVGFTQSEVKK